MLITMMLFAAAAQQQQVLPASGDEIVMTANPKQRCDSTGDEIIVCGPSDPNQFRLPKMGPRYDEKPVRSEFRIGNATAKLNAEQRGVGGVSVPSLMATIKIPLGGKKPGTDPE